MKIVMKFGGSLLIDGKSISYVANRIAEHARRKDLVVVIVSALKGVTDQLIEASEKAKHGNRKFVSEFITMLKERHLAVAKESIRDESIRVDVSKGLEESIAKLEEVLMGIVALKELTPRSRDHVLSFGERLSAPIVAGALRSLRLNSRYLMGQEAGIVTNDNFGEAIPLMELTKYQVKTKIEPLLGQGIIPVITGYIAATQDGIITTLGRGGSDYTATIVAAAIGADETWIWTTVDGLMTADPAIVPSAKLIRKLSFSEAAEMAVLGAKIMHPKSLEPAMEEGVPVRIKNIFDPSKPGTLIVKEAKVRPSEIVKAVTLTDNVALINVSGFGMVGTPGTAAKVFDVMGKNNINIFMISQSISEANISFVVRRDMVEKALSALEMELLGKELIRDITAEKDICVVAIVGAGMRGTPGIAARAFSAVARKGINIRMIAQGSSELNISFVVKEQDGKEAVRALHEEFELGRS